MKIEELKDSLPSSAWEEREVVSQSVTYHSAICPECGDVYISGGTTRTTTRSKDAGVQQQQSAQPEYKRSANSKLDVYA